MKRYLALALILALPLGSLHAQGKEPPGPVLILKERQARVVPHRNGFNHTGGGNIDVAQPAPDTVVCRCEDTKLNRIREHGTWRSASLQTRCGMGACQGRVCGPAIEFLLGLTRESVRPPLFPARLDYLRQVPPDSDTAR